MHCVPMSSSSHFMGSTRNCFEPDSRNCAMAAPSPSSSVARRPRVQMGRFCDGDGDEHPELSDIVAYEIHLIARYCNWYKKSKSTVTLRAGIRLRFRKGRYSNSMKSKLYLHGLQESIRFPMSTNEKCDREKREVQCVPWEAGRLVRLEEKVDFDTLNDHTTRRKPDRWTSDGKQAGNLGKKTGR